MLFFSLCSFSIRGRQSRPQAFARAVPLCSPAPHSSPVSLESFPRLLHWCPLMCTEGSTRLRKMLSPFLITLRWISLWKIWCKLCWFCRHKVCKTPGHSQQLMPFHSLALPRYLAHFQCAMCVFLSHAASLGHSWDIKSWSCHRQKKELIRKRDLKQLWLPHTAAPLCSQSNTDLSEGVQSRKVEITDSFHNVWAMILPHDSFIYTCIHRKGLLVWGILNCDICFCIFIRFSIRK